MGTGPSCKAVKHYNNRSAVEYLCISTLTMHLLPLPPPPPPDVVVCWVIEKLEEPPVLLPLSSALLQVHLSLSPTAVMTLDHGSVDFQNGGLRIYTLLLP